MGEDVLAMLVTDFPDGELLGGRTFVVAKADKAGDMTELKSAIDKYNVEFTFLVTVKHLRLLTTRSSMQSSLVKLKTSLRTSLFWLSLSSRLKAITSNTRRTWKKQTALLRKLVKLSIKYL